MHEEQPLVLDTTGRDVHAEGALLRERGPAAPVELPGGVRAWAVADFEVLRGLLTDPRVSRNARLHWGAWQRGEISGDWPFTVLVVSENMNTAYGTDHRRLRTLMSGAFTTRRVEALRPVVEEVADGLLDALAGLPAGEAVDLRQHFALPLPLEVVSRLFGLPEGMRQALREAMDVFFDTTAGPEETGAGVAQVFALLDELVRLRRDEPGDDLTSAMLAARAEGDAFTHDEIRDTLALMTAAGYETTVNLLGHAVAALLGHPDQLDAVRSGAASWDDVVEETLRWQAPVPYMPLRFAVEDIDLGGVVVPRGDAILTAYAAAGRDRAHYGDEADVFDLAREDKRHHAFGHGVHHCLGAPLARLEARVALPALFARFPRMALDVPPSALRPLPSMISNGHTQLPVRLSPAGS